VGDAQRADGFGGVEDAVDVVVGEVAVEGEP
jgi:hypothetical protein